MFLSLIQKNKQLLDTKEQLERKLRDLELLFELERATARASSLDVLIRAVLDQLVRACEARGACVLLAEEETGDLVQHVYDAERPSELLTARHQGRRGLARRGDVRRSSLSIADGRSRLALQRARRGALPVSASESVAGGSPLEGEDAPLGRDRRFQQVRVARRSRDEDASLLRLVSANVSTAVRLFRANRRARTSERLTHDRAAALAGDPRFQDADDRDQRLRAADGRRRRRRAARRVRAS